ncbi:MAG: DUF560 domain-containing protein [Geobacter sp.]|nr:DUF560 domain-containing protein [Geobacter sp.]
MKLILQNTLKFIAIALITPVAAFAEPSGSGTIVRIISDKAVSPKRSAPLAVNSDIKKPPPPKGGDSFIRITSDNARDETVVDATGLPGGNDWDFSLLVEQIHKLETENKQKEICDVLNVKTPNYKSASIDDQNEIHFYTAQCAASNRDFERALKEYEAILRNKPDTGRIWLEYAKTLVRGGWTGDALAAFSKVLKSNPPDQIKAFVLSEMASLNGKGTIAPFSNGRVTLGYLFDSNINNATSASEVMIWGLPFKPDTKPLSDQGVQLSGNYSVSKQNESHQLYADMAVATTIYNKYKDFNLLSFSASGGARIPFDSLLLEAPVHVDYLLVGGTPFRLAGGIMPKIYWNPKSSNWIANLGGVVDWQYFPNIKGKEGLQTSLSTGVKKLSILSQSDYIEAEITGGKTSSQSGDSDSTNWATALRYNYSGELISLSAEAQLNGTKYDADSFGTKHVDDGRLYSVSVSRKCFSLICSASFIHQENRSSVPINSYEKNVFNLQTHWQF